MIVCASARSAATDTWDQYRATRSPRLLSDLCHAHEWLVRVQLRIVRKQFPPWLDLDACRQEGRMALMRAIETDDPDLRVCKFETRAGHFIRHAMFDHGYWQARRHEGCKRHRRLHGIRDLAAIPGGEDPARVVADRDFRSHVLRVLGRDGFNLYGEVVRLHFFEGYTVEETGAEIGIPPVRVQRTLTLALRILRGKRAVENENSPRRGGSGAAGGVRSTAPVAVAAVR